MVCFEMFFSLQVLNQNVLGQTFRMYIYIYSKSDFAQNSIERKLGKNRKNPALTYCVYLMSYFV